MHIAIVNEEQCHFKKCNHECQFYCPPQRMGEKVVEFGEDGYPRISETLCIGCGICAHKCPYQAIKIINLPDEMKEETIHQYGENSFRLYRLPAIKKGETIGILGRNGIGKSTTINILSGIIVPNFGKYDKMGDKDQVIEHFRGTVYGSYFKDLYAGRIKIAYKPQYVDSIPKVYKGKVKDYIESIQGKRKDEVIQMMRIEKIMNRNIEELSGGELQSLAISVTLMKDADLYFFDEPSSYLDIKQRLEFAKIIKDLSQKAQVYVVEHDLAIMDFLADTVHIVYGSEGAYGIISKPLTANHALNSYLSGFLKEENVRIRDWEIKFIVHPPSIDKSLEKLIEWSDLTKKFESFSLTVSSGKLLKGEVVGVVGENATGKTTFVKMLAGVINPDSGKIDSNIKVSYKPQYIRFDESITVNDLFNKYAKTALEDPFFKNEIWEPFNLDSLMERDVMNLAGGELQKVAISLCFGREADVFLLDEPSAYLDSAERMTAAKIIRRFIEKTKKTALVVDHDIYFIDLISDSLMTFEGEPGISGIGTGPYNMRDGMNRFLKNVDITFRRDDKTKRPRINKPGSYNDREQKARGEYYYL